MTDIGATSPSAGTPPALLARLSQLATQTAATEKTTLQAIFEAIAEQLQVRTAFLSGTQAGVFEVLDMVNYQGCTLQAGELMPLPDTY